MLQDEKSQVNNTSESPAPAKKRGVLKCFFKYFSLFLLLLIICLFAISTWITQSSSGQKYLIETINNVLIPKNAEKELRFQITSLTGSLPFNFELSFEAFDNKGLWLVAPSNSFSLNWHELPKVIHIPFLRIANVNLKRLPDLPEDQIKKEDDKPFTLVDLQNSLKDAIGFLSEKNSWLPQIKIDKIALENAILPPELLPQAEKAENASRLCTDISLSFQFIEDKANAECEITLKNNDDHPVSLSGFNFQSLKTLLTTNVDINRNTNALNLQTKLNTTIENPIVEAKELPQDFLGKLLSLNLGIDCNVDTKDLQKASLVLHGPDLNAGQIQLASKGQWQSGEKWRSGDIDGKMDYNLDFLLSPSLDIPSDSPLQYLKKPATINLKAQAELPEINIALNAACDEINAQGHILQNIRVALNAPEFVAPLNDLDLKLLESERRVDLNLSATLDQELIVLATQLFVNQVAAKNTNSNESNKNWKIDLRDIKLDALGVNGTGHILTMLPDSGFPSLDGDLRIAIHKWNAISRFIPEQKLAGDVNMEILMQSAQNNAKSSQTADINLQIPTFSMLDKKNNKGVKIKNLACTLNLLDIFVEKNFDANLKVSNIAAADMSFDANLKSKGALSGPIEAEIKTSGSITSNILAAWQPGKVLLKKLDFDMQGKKITATASKNAVVGVHSSNVTEIDYGEQGIRAKNLDLRLLPSGKLLAKGGFSPDKLDFTLNLIELNLKPWQALIPAIPSGIVNVYAQLKGTPVKPAGNFSVDVKDVKVPDIALPLLGFTLKGNIAHSGSQSTLNSSLDLSPSTIKALGGNVASITCRLPLIFGSDGIPNINMNESIAAKVRWDGALAPLWNLVPTSGRRLNGKLAINMDANGTIQSPSLNGGVTIDNARFEDLTLGVLLTNIDLRLDLQSNTNSKKGKAKNGSFTLPGGLKLSLNATDGHGGTISVNGGGALSGENLDIKANINKLRPLRRRDVHIELSGQAQVKGSAMSPEIDGEIIVNQGEVLLNNLAISSNSVTTLEITEPQKSKQKAEQNKKSENSKKGRLNVRLNMLPRFSVEGRGLTSLWQAKLLVSGALDNPTITGDIRSVKGNFDFLGKNFALTKGIVFFGGGKIANPLLDIELTNETPNLIAHILVTGPADKMKFTLSSDPSLPRDEILSQVLFGKNLSEIGQYEAMQLAAAAAQLAGFGTSGGFFSTAKNALGLDVLRLGTSASGAAGTGDNQGLADTTIEMGKYINDVIYMGVQQGIKADSSAFIIQLDLTPNSSFEVRTERNQTWGGFKWKYNY